MSEDPNVFIEEFMNSIKEDLYSPGGTWSLKTLNIINKSVDCPNMNHGSYIANVLAKEFLKDTSTDLVRYKLAQLCSMLSVNKVPFFKEALHPYKKELIAVSNLSKDRHLADPTERFFHQIFKNGCKTVSNTPPPGQFMRPLFRRNDQKVTSISTPPTDNSPITQ